MCVFLLLFVCFLVFVCFVLFVCVCYCLFGCDFSFLGRLFFSWGRGLLLFLGGLFSTKREFDTFPMVSCPF